MTKVRVHELAKVLDTNSKELIALLAEYGHEIKNHMTVLEEEQFDIIFEVFTKQYDKKVEIHLLHYIRPEMRFDGLDTLVKQMGVDERKGRELLVYDVL